MEEYTPKFNSLVARLSRDITDVIGTLYEVAGHKDISSEQKEKCLDLIAEFKAQSEIVQSLFMLEEKHKEDKEDKDNEDKEDKEEKAFLKGFKDKD